MQSPKVQVMPGDCTKQPKGVTYRTEFSDLATAKGMGGWSVCVGGGAFLAPRPGPTPQPRQTATMPHPSDTAVKIVEIFDVNRVSLYLDRCSVYGPLSLFFVLV